MENDPVLCYVEDKTGFLLSYFRHPRSVGGVAPEMGRERIVFDLLL